MESDYSNNWNYCQVAVTCADSDCAEDFCNDYYSNCSSECNLFDSSASCIQVAAYDSASSYIPYCVSTSSDNYVNYCYKAVTCASSECAAEFCSTYSSACSDECSSYTWASSSSCSIMGDYIDGDSYDPTCEGSDDDEYLNYCLEAVTCADETCAEKFCESYPDNCESECAAYDWTVEETCSDVAAYNSSSSYDPACLGY